MRTCCLWIALVFTACGGSQSLPDAPTTPRQTYSVFGVVRADGSPVAYATVTVLEQRDSTVTTNANGQYKVQASTAQPWGLSPLLSASASGYFADIRFTDTNYRAITQDTQLDFELEPLRYIALGEVVQGRVGGAVCSHWGYGTGSCTRFAVRVPTFGTLHVTVSAAQPDFDVDIVAPDGSFASYVPNPSGSMVIRAPVSAGATYQIRLAGPAPREFQLRAALE
jgi:hypothetical protein